MDCIFIYINDHDEEAIRYLMTMVYISMMKQLDISGNSSYINDEMNIWCWRLWTVYIPTLK